MRSLHAKLALVLAGLLAVVTVALVALALRSAERYGAEVRQAMNREVAAHVAEDVLPTADGTLDEEALKGLFMKTMLLNPALEVYLLDTAGHVLAFDAPPEKVVRRRVDLAPVRRFLAGEPGLIEGDDPRHPEARKPFTAAPLERDGRRLGYLYVIVGGDVYESIAALLRGSHRLRLLAAMAVATFAAAALAGLLAFGWLTRPLRRLRAAVAGFREDRPPPRLEVGGRDELGDLARTFEAMGRRIAQSHRRLARADRQRREFVASVSHDLRTPLASLQGYLELLERDLTPEQRREYLANARRRARHLERLVDQLFELARLEAGDVELQHEEFCLAELVQDALQGHRPRAGARGVRLRCRLQRDLPTVDGDIALVERALENLLENATRHTPQGGEVAVRVRATDGQVEVRVSDTGCGIAPDELPRVFDRAWRGERRVRSGREGTGLGLAITRRILELHGGAVDVASAEDEGTTFRFALPAHGRPRAARRHRDRSSTLRVERMQP